MTSKLRTFCVVTQNKTFVFYLRCWVSAVITLTGGIMTRTSNAVDSSITADAAVMGTTSGPSKNAAADARAPLMHPHQRNRNSRLVNEESFHHLLFFLLFFFFAVLFILYPASHYERPL